MTTENTRVSASSVMRRVAEMQPTANNWRLIGVASDRVMIRASVPSDDEYDLMTRRIGARALELGLVAVTAFWMLALLGATALASLAHPGLAAYLFSSMVFFTGSLLCHQR